MLEDGVYTGRVLLPFPPLPAVLLLPFVALWGLAVDQESMAIGSPAVGVFTAWWMLGGLRITLGVRALTTLVFATGTVWWWAAAVGSTWYLAHLVAAVAALLAVGVALRADPAAAEENPWDEGDRAGRPPRPGARRRLGQARPAARIAGRAWPLSGAQVLAGLILGIGATARLPLVFAAPFLVLVGGGGSSLRRTISAAVGAVLPVAALLAYTWLTTGSVLHPGYDYQYQLEANGYPTLGYHPEWAVEDIRYVPQNLGIMLGALPEVLPDGQARHPGRLPDGHALLGARRDSRPVRPRLPARAADRHRHQRPAVLARPAAGAVRDPAPSDRPPHARIRADRPRDRRCSTSPTSARAGSSGATGSRSTSSRSCCRSSRSAPPAPVTGARGRPRSCSWSPGAALNLWGVVWGQLLGW